MTAGSQQLLSLVDAPNILDRDFWSERAIRQALAAFLHDHRSELDGKQILDYGAADSPYAAMAAGIGARMLAADIGDAGPDSIAIDSDGHVQLADGSVDAIVSTQVLEHVPDVQRYLSEAMRVLRPGAPLFISTHGDWVLHRVPTDFRRWTMDGLEYECARTGFQVRSMSAAVGILASSTHLRSSVVGGVLGKSPLLNWLRPIVYLAANLRMGLEDLIAPASAMARRRHRWWKRCMSWAGGFTTILRCKLEPSKLRRVHRARKCRMS